MVSSPMVHDRTLVSYDASGSARAHAARACQIVFGYDQQIHREGVARTVRRKGYLDRPGALRIGQSVILLRDEDAHALARDLVRLGLLVRTLRIRVRSEDLLARTRADVVKSKHVNEESTELPIGARSSTSVE